MNAKLSRKYHIAIMDTDPLFVKKVVKTLKKWYSNKIVIEGYTSHEKMFFGMNVAAEKRNPFDVAIIKSDDIPTSMIIKHTNPSIKVLMCNDVKNLEKETSKVLV